MSEERIVLSPGPVHIPPKIWEEIRPVHHRSEEFRTVVRETESLMRELLGTESPIYTITSSGTGGMEFAVANVTSPGSRVMVVSGGKFGDRWGELCKVYGCVTEILRFSEGKAIDVGRVVERAGAIRPDIIALTHVESSTGVRLPLETLLGALPETRPVILLDAIASAGVETLDTDAWGVDVAVTASQKAFGAPPGVSFVCVGRRAHDLAIHTGRRLYYISLEKYEEGRTRGDTPFTPAVHVVQIVHRALERMRIIGWERARDRHRRASRAFTEALRCCALDVFPENPSYAVQAFCIPTACGLKDFVEELARKGIVVAGGQGPLAGKVIRTGFLGLHGGSTLARAVSSIAAALRDGGCRVDEGSAERAITVLSDQEELFL
jgi:aspartate aminotransferase-like enzyme